MQFLKCQFRVLRGIFCRYVKIKICSKYPKKKGYNHFWLKRALICWNMRGALWTPPPVVFYILLQKSPLQPMMKLYVNSYTILVVYPMLWSGQKKFIFAKFRGIKAAGCKIAIFAHANLGYLEAFFGVCLWIKSCSESKNTRETIKKVLIWVLYMPNSQFFDFR